MKKPEQMSYVVLLNRVEYMAAKLGRKSALFTNIKPTKAALVTLYKRMQAKLTGSSGRNGRSTKP